MHGKRHHASPARIHFEQRALALYIERDENHRTSLSDVYASYIQPHMHTHTSARKGSSWFAEGGTRGQQRGGRTAPTKKTENARAGGRRRGAREGGKRVLRRRARGVSLSLAQGRRSRGGRGEWVRESARRESRGGTGEEGRPTSPAHSLTGRRRRRQAGRLAAHTQPSHARLVSRHTLAEAAAAAASARAHHTRRVLRAATQQHHHPCRCKHLVSISIISIISLRPSPNLRAHSVVSPGDILRMRTPVLVPVVRSIMCLGSVVAARCRTLHATIRLKTWSVIFWCLSQQWSLVFLHFCDPMSKCYWQSWWGADAMTMILSLSVCRSSRWQWVRNYFIGVIGYIFKCLEFAISGKSGVRSRNSH